MSTQIETERKFLVKFPSSWEDLSLMFENLVSIKRILQYYLIPKNGEQAARIRKTIDGLIGNKEIYFDFNQKDRIDSISHKEKEYRLTKSQYEKHLKEIDPNKFPVEKTRFVFKYNDQIFELDAFKGRLNGLAILEIELKNKDSKIELPPFIKIIKEVSRDKKYNNFNLANKCI